MAYNYTTHGGHGHQSSRHPAAPPPQASASPSSWPHFIREDGIAHAVIQSDICRYLGSDATMRRGVDEHGRPGYYYNSYRPFTSAMIATLKEDSAKWEAERSDYRRRYQQAPEYYRSDTYRARGDHMTGSSNPVAPTPISPPPPPAAPPAQPPRYLYTRDGQPYWDTHTQRYMPPFDQQAAHATNVPRYDPGSDYTTSAPTQPTVSRPPPVDSNGQPIPGYYGTDARGQVVFFTTAPPQ